MAKITQKSTNAVLKAYRNQKTDISLHITNPDNPDEIMMEISVKPDMTIPEKGAFVDRVVYSCFDVDGDFLPQYLDPVFDISLLQMTTNVPVFEKEITPTLLSGNEAPTTVKALDIEKTYQLCKTINLIHNVDDDRYRALVADLKDMVNTKLEYMKQVNSKKTSNMLHILQPMLKSLQEIIESNISQDSLKDMLQKSEKEIDNLIQFSSSDKE